MATEELGGRRRDDLDQGKLAVLEERSIQIVKTVDTMIVRFDASLDTMREDSKVSFNRLQDIVLQLTTSTTAQIVEHIRKEEELWKSYTDLSDKRHEQTMAEVDKVIFPINNRITALEKIVWRWGGGIAASLFIIALAKDTLVRFFGS